MKILNQIKICSNVGMHAWYETDLGFAIRKPIGKVERPKDVEIKSILVLPQVRIRLSFWRRLINFIKSLWN